MRALRASAFLLLPAFLFAQGPFSVPPRAGRELPVDRLERVKVADTSRLLSEPEKRELCRLFVRAHVDSVRQHRQGFFLNTGAPVYRLLVTNFPEVREREGEGGSVIYLGEVMGFFNSKPEFREEVLKILREGADKRICH